MYSVKKVIRLRNRIRLLRSAVRNRKKLIRACRTVLKLWRGNE
ncbi:MAG: hypothetical protein ACOX8E_02460 [Ruminococcus sp.]